MEEEKCGHLSLMVTKSAEQARGLRGWPGPRAFCPRRRQIGHGLFCMVPVGACRDTVRSALRSVSCKARRWWGREMGQGLSSPRLAGEAPTRGLIGETFPPGVMDPSDT